MATNSTFIKLMMVSLFLTGTLITVSAQKDMPDTAGLFRNDMIDGHKVYSSSSPMPQYPDDVSEFLADNLKYPSAAGDWMGSVYATFVIDSTGNIRNPMFIKKSADAKDIPKCIVDEYLNVINNQMIRWRPGYKNGRPVSVRVFLQGVLFEPGMEGK